MLNINSINSIRILESINWTEAVLPGVFTLVGATIGAMLAGRYAVNAVKKQLKYDEINRNLDSLDNELKINKRFSTLLKDDIEKLDELFKIINMDQSKEGYDDIVIITLENTIRHFKKTYQSLEKLNIDDIPYKEHQYYINTLDNNEKLQMLCIEQITNFKNIKKNKENDLKENPFTLEFPKDSTQELLSISKSKMKTSYDFINQREKHLLNINKHFKECLEDLT